MNALNPSSPREEWRAIFSDSLRYWERRRIAYNLILAAICVAWILLSWPHSRPRFTWPDFVALLILAMLANLCYCAAYLADIPCNFLLFGISGAAVAGCSGSLECSLLLC